MKIPALFVCLSALCYAGSGLSAPFLVSDPQCYDADGTLAICPDGYEYSDDGGLTWVPLGDVITPEGTISIREDLAIYADSAGTLDWEVRAVNTVWGKVSASVPFSFDTTGPGSPTGLKVVSE
jgi:hypothetical protein